jgi:L-threonylcarbamoyladenylate synthase
VTAPSAIARAVQALRAGELVGFPTETVYGLGADARNRSAVQRIFELKGRPATHPLIVHLADAGALPDWAAEVPAAARALAARFWPGPLTLVLPRAAGVPDEVTGGAASIALRVPSHPLARALLTAFGGGIAAPSANRYGRVSATTAAHVRAEFGSAVPVVLEGECSVGLESTIVSCLGAPLLLRPGALTQAELEAAIGPLRRAARSEGPPAPGSMRAHYAPATPLRLLASEALAAAVAAAGCAVLARAPAPHGYRGPLWIDAGAEPARYAHDLYANLRRLDAAGAQAILVEAPPDGAAWDAINDRLQRAAAACDAEEFA